MLLQAEGVLSITTMPPMPTMERWMSVLPNRRRGIGSVFFTEPDAAHDEEKFPLEAAMVASVPCFKKSRRSMGSSWAGFDPSARRAKYDAIVSRSFTGPRRYDFSIVCIWRHFYTARIGSTLRHEV